MHFTRMRARGSGHALKSGATSSGKKLCGLFRVCGLLCIGHAERNANVSQDCSEDRPEDGCKDRRQTRGIDHARGGAVRGVVLHHGHGAGDAAAPRPQIRRHVHGLRRPRRYRGVAAWFGRLVPLRHALSLASRIAGERDAAAPPRLQSARRQLGVHRRPHQPRPYRRPARRPGKGHRAHSAHDVLMAGHRLSALRRAQLWRRQGRSAAFDSVRE